MEGNWESKKQKGIIHKSQSLTMTHEHSWLNREQNTSLCHCGTEHIEGWEPEGCKWHFWWNGDIYIKWKLLMSSFYRQKYWHPWVYKFTPPPQKKKKVLWFLYFFMSLHCLDQRFSTPVLAPPRSAHFACLCCLNTPDSDHQLIRRKFHEWTVFRLTCSLHSVHCSLLPKHEKSVDVYFTSELIYSRICATPASSHTDETY